MKGQELAQGKFLYQLLPRRTKANRTEYIGLLDGLACGAGIDDLAGRGWLYAGYDAQQGRFTAAIGAQQGVCTRRCEGVGDVLKHTVPLKTLAYRLKGDVHCPKSKENRRSIMRSDPH